MANENERGLEIGQEEETTPIGLESDGEEETAGIGLESDGAEGTGEIGLEGGEPEETEEIVLHVDVGDEVSAKQAEAWAVGERAGDPVGESDPTYHNNAKYYAEQAAGSGRGAAGSAAAAAESAAAAGASATAAAGSATAAAGSASAAEDAATAAEGSAEDAEAWANGKRDGADVVSGDPAYQQNAKYFASRAASSASSANSAANAASNAANRATDFASSASSAASNASSYASSASNSASNAADSADLASQRATAAAGSATAAAGSATTAEQKATAAAGSATTAEQKAAAAAESATAAEDSAEAAEAWAIGKRGGADVESGDPTYENSSKYWAGQAAAGAADAADSAEEAADSTNLISVMAVNLAQVEEDIQGVASAAEEAEQIAEDMQTALTELDSLFDSMGLSRKSRINRPNLLEQNFWTNRNMPSGTVVYDAHEIPAEDATAAAQAITYTIENESITSSFAVIQKTSSDYDHLTMAGITVSCASGAATVTVPARTGAHNAAITLKIWICAQTNQNVVYGNVSRIRQTNGPYMESIYSGAYPGDDQDEIIVSLASLAAADQITDGDGETYTKAIQYNITAATAWGNTEDLYYPYSQYTAKYRQGQQAGDWTKGIKEMEPGKTYTVSCWVRVISGDGVMIRFGWGGTYLNSAGYPADKAGKSESITVTGSGWKRVSWTFEFNPTGAWYTETTSQETVDGQTVTWVNRTYNWMKRVIIGVHRKWTAVAQITGFRLTEGSLYLPTQYDGLSERVDRIEEETSGKIGGVMDSIADGEGSTAGSNHAAGELIAVGEQLYRTTAAIAAGESITPGTNCRPTTIAAEIAALAALIAGGS